MSTSVLYMSMSLDGYIAGPNDSPENPGGDNFKRLHEWYGSEQGKLVLDEAGGDRRGPRGSAHRGAGRSLGR